MAEPTQGAVGLPALVTDDKPGEAPAVELPKKPEEEGLIDYQGTVRVPFLEEVGLISPYKGKETVLELGPSVEKLGAMGTGAVEGFSPYVATFLEAMASPFTKPITEKEKDPVREAARQRKLKRTLEVAKKFDQTVKEKKERVGAITEPTGIVDPLVGFFGNTASDVKDVFFGLATLFHETVGIQAREAGQTREEAGKKFGKELSEGLVLITGSVFEGAEEPGDFIGAFKGLTKSFGSRPLTTILTILPVIQAAKRVAPLRKTAIEAETRAGKVWEASNSTVPWETVKAQVNKLPGVAKAADFLNKKVELPLRRTLEEPTLMETAGETRIAEQVIDEPRITQEKVAARAKQLGREITTEEVAEFQKVPQLSPEEALLYEEATKKQTEFAKEQRFKLEDDEGATYNVADTGSGEAFTAGAELLGVTGNNLNTLFAKAQNFYNRLVIQEIPAKQAVLKAGLVELVIEAGGDPILYSDKFQKPMGSEVLNAMVKSLEKRRKLLAENTLIQDLTTTSVKRPPVVTEVFEVGDRTVVRQPKSRTELTADEIAAYRFGREANYEIVFQDTKVDPKARNIARKELREMTERTIAEQPRTDAPPTHPAVEPFVNYVHKQVSKLFPEYNKALFPDAEILIEQSPYSKRAIRRRITQALDSETVSLLRDPSVAAKARSSLNKAAKEAGVPLLARRRMLKAFNEFIAETAGQISETTFPEFKYNGKTFFGRPELLDTFSKLSKKQKTRAAEFVTSRIGFEISAELETVKQVGAMNAELNRFVTPQNIAAPDIYAVQMATEVIGNSQPRPLIIPHNGKSVAASLRSNAAQLGKAIANKTGTITKEMATQQVLDLAKHIDGFVPMAKTIGVVERAGIKGLASPQKLSASYAYAPFNRSVFWDLAAKNGALAGGAFNTVVGIGNLFKRNVVARSTPSLVNNNISNTLGVSARRGVTAPQVLYSVTRFSNRLRNYLNKKKPPPDAPLIEQMRYELVEAMDREGLFSTNDVKKDFTRQARAEKVPTDIAVERLGAGIDAIQNFFEYTYTRYGDDVFKGETGFHRGNRAINQLQETRVGYNTRFENNPNSHWQVKKTSPTTFEGELFSNTGKSRGNKFTADLSSAKGRSKLMSVIARDGLYYGNELFFDYGRVGNWTKILRALPITNLTSSFHTWYFKALDIPFVKKGLVYKTLLQTDTIPSTDPLIMRKNQTSNANLAARRALIANSTVGATQQRIDEKTARVPLSFSPSRQELSFVVAATHPDYILQYALGSRDYTDPTVMGLKAIQKSLLLFRDDDQKMKELFPPRSKIEKMSDEEWAKLQKQRKYFMKTMDGTILSPKEALELVGIGGSIVLNFYDYIREAEKQGKVIDLPGVFRNFGKAMVGSNVARLADIAVAGGVEGGLLPDTAQRYTRLGKQEMRRGYRSGQVNPNQSDFIQYAIKEMFGLGWNSIMYLGGQDEITGGPTSGAIVRYVNGLKKELKANLVKPKQNEARRALAKEQAATDPEQQKFWAEKRNRLEFEADQINDAIEDQAEIYLEQYERALLNIYYRNKVEEETKQ